MFKEKKTWACSIGLKRHLKWLGLLFHPVYFTLKVGQKHLMFM